MTRYPCKAGCGATSNRANRTCLSCYRKAQTPYRGPDCLEKCGAKTHKKGSRCRSCHGKFIIARNQASQPLMPDGRRGFYCSNGCGAVVFTHGRCRACRKTSKCVDCQTGVLSGSVRCASCQIRLVHASDAPKTPKTKPVEKLRQVTLPTTHPCLGECGLQMAQPNTRCLSCRKLRQNVIAAVSELKQKRRIARNALSHGNAKALMEFGTEIYILSYACQTCAKPIMAKWMCFECSTGYTVPIPIHPVITLKRDVEVVEA